MSAKRYYAEDMRQALKAVREELGPDAVILSNERVAGGVQVLAMRDQQQSDQAPEASTRTDLKEPSTAEALASKWLDSPQEASRITDQPGVQPPPQYQFAEGDASFANLLHQYQQPAQSHADDELMQTMRSEIENLRFLLQDQLNQSAGERWQYKNPVAAAVARRLTDLAISESVAQKFADQVSSIRTIEDAWERAQTALELNLPVLGRDLINEGGVVALLGPTGAGKTTTIAKLAIRYALEYGRESLALVTTDCFRVAAYDQLRTLGRIMDIPVRRVDEQNSLRKLLRSFRDKSLVLVDMAGFHAANHLRRKQLASLNEVDLAVTRLLVLPCTSQAKVLQRDYNLVASEGLSACILTKVDEAESMGEALSIVLKNDLPVAYVTNGQSIPDNIEIASSDRLLGYLLREDENPAVQTEKSIGELLSAVPTEAAQNIGLL